MKPLHLCLVILIIILSGCRGSKSLEKTRKDNKRIVLEISDSIWFTKLTKPPDAMVGYVNLAISGKTNAERLTVRTYGDGVWGEQPLEIDKHGMFNDTIGISFTYFSSPPDFSAGINSKTVVKAYLESATMDTTLISGPLYYEK